MCLLKNYGKLTINYLTLAQLATFVRKYTKKVGSYVEIYSGPLCYKTKDLRGSRVRKITRVNSNEYSCEVKYVYNQKRLKFTSYETSCFMQEYQNGDFHSLRKTLKLLYDHDKYEDQLYPYRIKINNKSCPIFVKEFAAWADRY